MKVWVLCAQLLCNPLDWIPPASSVHVIFQARILEWVAISLSGNLLDPGTEPTSLASLALAGRVFTTSATWEDQEIIVSHYFLLSTVQISFWHKYFSDHTSQLWILSLLNFQHIFFSFHFGRLTCDKQGKLLNAHGKMEQSLNMEGFSGYWEERQWYSSNVTMC